MCPKRKLNDKKKQKRYYSGKQKCHTLKTQLIINQADKSVICMGFRQGRQHDFRIFKNSRVKVIERVQVLSDKGYQGIRRYHTNSYIPPKKPINGQLTKAQKRENKEQSRRRVRVENVIRHLKISRILSSRYRNRRKRFSLRVNLIAGLYYYELKFAASFEFRKRSNVYIQPDLILLVKHLIVPHLHLAAYRNTHWCLCHWVLHNMTFQAKNFAHHRLCHHLHWRSLCINLTLPHSH